ncbi:hypothetical protein MKW98_002320 [Papaver atlanticum]|uniref:Legume lectin domain-containing protein n=1 Tax=Papaver atlanticum TaxID=357466 RepID=A0AAD4RUY8_9MAGN|nr:hypothetical protein MKW98_002320 [Papaver atlanticum]
MRTIYFKVAFFFFLMIIDQSLAADADGFFFNDFKAAFVTRDGAARITDNGLLQLTDLGDKYETGNAFYSDPLKLKKGSVSFSTTFVFAIASELGANKLSGQGMAFVIAPQRALPGALPNQYLGLFNDTSNGQSSNNVLAVEIDTVYNIEFDTIQGPHVGIDINSLKSVNSTDPAYYVNGESKQINVNSGEPVQVWIEYHGIDKKLTVTLAPLNTMKPDTPLLTLSRDLSTIFLDDMYVGFSASTQTVLTYHYILGWSFKIDGAADALNLSSLPKLPPQSSSSQDNKPNLAADSDQGFTYNDFKSAYITRDGAARVAENGLLRLTDVSDRYETGHVFYSGPLKLKGNVSFSTTFVIAIASELGTNQLSGQGMAFVIAPQRAMPGALANQ